MPLPTAGVVTVSDSADPVYEIHGLAVRSAEPLDAPLSDRAPDWVVHRGEPVDADGPPAGELIGEYAVGEFEYWSTAHGPRRRRWIVRHGGTAQTEFDLECRTITLRSDPRAVEGYSALLLAGSGLAHALAADGHATMHASAIEVGGRAIGFIGPSGKGKTTLAALLCATGARAVTDDVLRCEFDGESAFCFRGSSRLRLRPQAAALAEQLAPLEQTADGRTSVRAEPTPLERLPLVALVVPQPSREARAIGVSRLRGRSAAAELLRSPRLIGWIERELATRHLHLCQQLAQRVPVLEVTVPWGPPFPDSLAEDLIDQVLSPP